MEMENITIPIIFLAGLLSFFSPCLLPIIPAFLARLAGVSFDDVVDQASVGTVRKKTFLAGLGFCVGFFIAATLLLLAISTLISVLPDNVKSGLRIAGGILVIAIALSYFGVYNILPLMKEKRVVLSEKVTSRVSFFTNVLIGGAFVLGWSPCIGTQMGTVIMMIGVGDMPVLRALGCMVAYTLGIIIPFMAITLCFRWFVIFLPKLNKKIKYFEWLAGLVLIVMGIMLLSDKLQPITVSWF